MRRRLFKTQSPVQAVRYKTNHKKKLPLWIFILILIIFIGLMIGQSKFLVAQTIEISWRAVDNTNSHLISEEEVGEMIDDLRKEKFLFFFSKNTLLLPTNQEITRKLLRDPRIASVKISRDWLKRTIKIAILEKTPVARLSIWGDKDYYLLSPNILRPLITETNIELPLILDKTTLIWSSKELLQAVENALKAIKTLDKEQDRVSLISLEISENNGIFEAKVTTDQGWHIFLLLNDQLEQQMGNLKLVLNNKIQKTKIEYIDLRFGNKIFYK